MTGKRKQRKKLKRFNGQGTVYKLSGRRRRPWIAQVTVGWDVVDGKKLKRIPLTLGYYELETDALDALDRYRLSIENPSVKNASMTLQEVYDIWSGNKFKEEISESTIFGIKASWKKLLPLAPRSFGGIRSDEFQNIINTCRDVDEVSRSTLTKLKSLIYALCDYAYHNSILKTNYSTQIKVGKVETDEKRVFNDTEIKTMKENIDKVPWADTILVLCYTGMRPTEMLTLAPSNVNLERRIITGGIKTKAGKNRIIPIHPVIYPIVEKWYNKKGETIFCDKNGKPLTARAYREKRYKLALEAMGIRPLNPGCCRHTFATRMNKHNAPHANVQKILGHVVGSDTTVKVYTHPEIEDLRKTIEMLD